jgi:flagellar biosynthesis chaperone FliJ
MDRTQLIEKLKSELDKLNRELDNADEKIQQLSGEGKKAYEKQIDELRSLVAEAKVKYDKAKGSAEENWKEMQENIEFTAKALKNSVNYFMSHFKQRKKE